VRDELGGDRQVIAAGHPLPVAARVGGRTLGTELKRQDVREPGAQPVHRPLGTDGIGERDGEEVPLAAVMLAGRQQVVQAAGQHGEPPVYRGGHPLGAHRIA